MRRIALALSILASCAASAAALTASELTPQEQERYAAVKSDPAAAQSFLITREYARHALSVVKNPAVAADFPNQPKGFDVRYLLPGESDAISRAVTLSVAAMAQSLWG